MLISFRRRSDYFRPRCQAFLSVLLLAMAGMAGVAMAADSAAPPRFDLLEFRIEGNSLLAEALVEAAVTPHLGEGRSLDDVEAARASLEKRYHDAGFMTVLVSIPEQRVEDGVVNLLVTEAPVSKLRVVGSQYHLPSVIKGNIPQLAEGQVPNFVELQKSLESVNNSADLKVAPILKPGIAPGTVEVQLDVDDQLPLHGQFELNNRQALNTSALRLAGAVRYDNLWQRGHSFGINAQVSPQSLSETRVLAANYLFPWGDAGSAMTLYAVSSRSKFATLYNQPGMGVLGNTTMAGLRYSLPLESARAFTQSYSLGVDYKDVKQSLVTDQVTPTPAVQYVPLSLSYRGAWNDDDSTSILDLSTILGMRGLFGNSDQAFDAKQTGATATFAAFRSTLQFRRRLGNWSLASKLELQLASGRLLPSEQFVAGGIDSVRGYFEGERTGDNAIRVSFELGSPPLKGIGLPASWRVSGVAFVDDAWLQNLRHGVGQEAQNTLIGLGAGLRIAGPRGTQLQFDLARAMTAGDVAGGGTHRGDWVPQGRLSVEF